MRVFILLIIAAAATAANGKKSSIEEPLVSYDKVHTLVTSSVELGVDLVKFGSYKIEESLNGETKKVYSKFVNRLEEYSTMVWTMVAPVRALTVTAFGTVMSVVKNRYDAFNKLNHQYVDPIVVDFEGQFPSSAGLVGHELVDRLFVAVWIYYFFKCSIRLAFRKCGGCCKKTK